MSVPPNHTGEEARTDEWVGNFFGTHPATVSLQIEHRETGYKISGRYLRGSELWHLSGENIQRVAGTIALNSWPSTDESQTTQIFIEISSVDSHEIRGKWRDTRDGMGVFVLNYIPLSQQTPPSPALAAAPQIVVAEDIIEQVELFKIELDGLIARIQTFFRNTPQTPILINYPQSGERIISYYDDAVGKTSTERKVHEFRIQATDQSQPIHKIVIVEFRRDGTVFISSQADDRIWVYGSKEAIRSYLLKHSSKSYSIIGKILQFLAIVAFCISVSFMIDMNFYWRSPFLLFTMLTIGSIQFIFGKLKKNTIWLDETARTFLSAQRNQIAVTILATILTLVVPAIGSYIVQHSPNLDIMRRP